MGWSISRSTKRIVHGRVTKDNEDHIRKLLEIIGEDPDGPGLIETPKRVLKAYDEWFAGYSQDPFGVLKKQFVQEDYIVDSMIVCKISNSIQYCKHHMAPFKVLHMWPTFHKKEAL